MYKEIIIMAKSSKHDDYCIAGIDVKTGKWIRPISTNTLREGAVPLEDITYEDGTEVQILDKVRIKFLSHNPTDAQPENYIYDDKEYWQKVGSITLNELIDLRGYDDPEVIFYNTSKEVTEDEVGGEPSLLFVNVKNSYVFIKTFDEDKKYQFNFHYKGNTYSFFKISDEIVKNKLASRPDGQYMQRDELSVVFSLTDRYNRTGKYYKMVAQMFY